MRSLSPCLVVLGALAGGCSDEARGEIVAEGAWSDGDPIRFHQNADVSRAPDGRLDIRSMVYATTRFMGIRISYYPDAIPTPGTYKVDPAPQGRIELYCIRPGDNSPPSDVVPPKEVVEAEVSAATITVTTVPGPGQDRLQGSFADVKLDRMGQSVLTLREGTFWATKP